MCRQSPAPGQQRRMGRRAHVVLIEGGCPDSRRPADDAGGVGLRRLNAGLSSLPVREHRPAGEVSGTGNTRAFRLNGQFLPPRNGFPARALVGGWYAMDSVKWLQRIVLLGPDDRPGSF